MKFIIIGLGHFGASLGERLTSMGHEVIGVDKHMDKVDALKQTNPCGLSGQYRFGCHQQPSAS